MRWILVLTVLCASTPSLLAADPSVDTVVLTNGDVLTGRIIGRTDDSLTLQHPVLGPVTVPTASVSSVTAIPADVDPEAVARAASAAATAVAAGEPATAAPATEAEQEIEEVKPGLFGTNFLKGWTKTVQAGFSGNEGNTRTLNINLGANLFFEDDRDRWDFATRYNLTTDRGQNTANNFYAQLQKDWLFPDSKWFIFSQGRYDYDQFQSWEHRLAGAGGVGYQFVQNDTWELRGKAGLGATKEFGSAVNEIVPDAVAGLSGSWNITDNMKLVASSEAYKGLLETDQFRTISTLEYIIAIDKQYGLNLKFGLEHMYQNVVDSGRERNDLTYYGALMLDF